MSRKVDPSEPWFHSPSGYWCKKIRGKRVYLSRDLKSAKRRLREILEKGEFDSADARNWLSARFSELSDEFLTDVQARRSEGTYRNYREQLLRAMKIMGPAILVGEVRRIHLRKVEREMTGKLSPATIRDTISVVQQVFNWAVEMDLLDSTPVAKYAKPAGRNRSRVMTADEFQIVLRHSDPAFRRFLIALRFTGCRPGEARTLTWTMVDLQSGMWILPKHKTVTMQQDPMPRVIPLPAVVLRLCQWLARTPHLPDDHVFLNFAGTPYTKNCSVRKMARIRKRAGIEPKNGENLILYSNRHAYATDAVGQVTDTELAELMGHTTTRTLRRYVHLNAKRLQEIQKKIQR